LEGAKLGSFPSNFAAQNSIYRGYEGIIAIPIAIHGSRQSINANKQEASDGKEQRS
jgi:hypothetical protein